MDHTTTRNIDYLDRHIPLRDASHADVTRYSVDIPMRYAECRAELAGGGIARLYDKRQFLGRSAEAPNSALLFVCDRELIVLRTASRPSPVQRLPWRREKFIGLDGEIFEIGRWRMLELTLSSGSRQSTFSFQPKPA